MCLLVASVACLASSSSTLAARVASGRHTPGISPADAAATRAYLEATSADDEAELANLPQATAAREATAAQISGECAGVLTNAPPHEEVLAFGFVGPGPGPGPETPPSARAEGERRRQSRQLGDLKTELFFALDESPAQPDREATAALLAALAPLKWSNPDVTLFVQTLVALGRAALEIPPAPVCADMKAWVASGYKTLAPASKEIASRSEVLVEDSFELIAIAEHDHASKPSDIFSPYEDASDRSLSRHIEALKLRQQEAPSDAQAAIVKRVEATVGLPAEKTPKVEPPKHKPVVIARGRTAAGRRFIARAERSTHASGFCSAFITIEEASRPTPGLLSALSGEGTSKCVSRSHVNAEPTVHCESGLLTIEAGLLTKTRSVSLLLSDGETISSPAIRVPARLGGPAGLYYQAVRGPKPIPVSLTELDASGNTVAVLKLPAVVECTKQPVKHFPGGNVRLVHESPPQTPSFTIRGEHFRKLGAEHFELKFEAANEERLFGGSEGGGGFGGGVAVPNGSGRTLEPMASTGCEPQPYAIIYGLLKAPRDTVLARVSGNLVPLHKVAIPAREHAGGVLVYGAFSPLPTELIIRGPTGETVNARSLVEAAKSEIESCEGEAEG